ILASSRDEVEALLNKNPYDMDNFAVQSESDYVVVRILLEAVELLKKKDNVGAQRKVEVALDLAPNFFEVRRVEASVAAQQGNLVKAQAAFEAAISLAPSYAPLRLWYANFLWRYLQEITTALAEMEQALRLDPNSAPILIDLARLELF